MEHFLQETAEIKTRPTLLTVLCILTFIGSSWSIIQGVMTFTTAGEISGVAKEVLSEQQPRNDSAQANFPLDSLSKDSLNIMDSAQLAEDQNQPEKSGLEIRMEENMKSFLDRDKLRNNAIGSIIAAIFTLAGAIFMWRLNRKGFYLYITGVIIGIAVPFLIFPANIFVMGMVGVSGFFGLLFIVLYALNLKNMNS